MFSFINKIIEKRKLLKEISLIKERIDTTNIVFITGAGISIESGIAPFRGKNGIYTKNPELGFKLRPDSFKTDPQFLYDFHEEFKRDLLEKKPNSVHEIIAKHGHVVITQNIDDLHEKAGSDFVLHLHGEVNEYRCQSCGNAPVKGDFLFHDSCDCGASLRHNVVLFKESVLHIEKAQRIIKKASLLIQIGTSGKVYPAANLAVQADFSITVNPELPDNSHLFNYNLVGNPKEILKLLLDEDVIK